VRSAPSDILRTWLSRPVAVASWAVAILFAGSWAALQLPLEWVPQVELPEVRISASWPGASPRAVERYVTAPIERAVQGVPGTQHVESLSEEGTSTVILSVSEQADLAMYVAQVGEELMLLRDDLPDRVRPRLTKRVPDALRDEQGFMTLQLLGPGSADALRTVADDRLAPRLRSLEGVADVHVEGGSQRELLIELDTDRLTTYGVTPADVQRALGHILSDEVYGTYRAQGQSLLLYRPSDGRLETLRRAVVRAGREGARPIRLADVARVDLGPAPLRSISRIDGQSVITLTIERQRGSHMLETARSVEARLTELRAELPESMRLLVADDRSASVREELDQIARLGGLGFALVVLVLLFMLRGVRATAVVLLSVAVSVAAAVWLLGPLNLTLNLLTIAGLVLVFGLLVDNSVVMVEQILFQRERLAAVGLRGLELDTTASAEALRAVWIPLLGGTLSTMAVMLPLVYLSGELRSLFLPFGVLVALTLAASLIVAVVLVPVLARYLPHPERRRKSRRLKRIASAPYRLVAAFPRSTIVLLVLVMGVPTWMLPTSISMPDDRSERDPRARLVSLYNDAMGRDAVRDAREKLDPLLGGVLRPFIRQVNMGQRWGYETRQEVYVSLRFPPGNPIERADELLRIFEEEALNSVSVSRTIARVSERAAHLRVQFHDDALRDAEPYMARERLIGHATRLAGITVSVGGLLPTGYYSGSGGGISGMRVEAFGPSYDDLEALTEAFAERLRRNPRVADVNTNAGRFGIQDTREVLRFTWDADARVRSGATAAEVASVLRPVFATRFPALYADIEDEPRTAVRVVVRGADQTDVASLAERPLNVGEDRSIQLASMAPYTIETVSGAIERLDQQYRRYVSIDYRGPYRMGHEFLERELEAFALPAGYRLDRGSFFFLTAETRRAIGWVLLATIGLVFLIMAAVFESWRLPLVVMLSVPMAVVGVSIGFLWSEANFAEGAFIGVVLLVGIAVNDSILLTDRYRRLRTWRPSTDRSLLIRLAVRERLRPMWTTTLSTTATLLPLLVFHSAGEFWLGLAVTVTGGLIAATLLAPLVTVAMIGATSRV
jgi:hydrophobic/amphiphilic exporter-1 (mainly G- bacteria), HAE1 family